MFWVASEVFWLYKYCKLSCVLGALALVGSMSSCFWQGQDPNSVIPALKDEHRVALL